MATLSEAKSDLGQILHEYIFMGGIRKGGTWGGPGCRDSVPTDVFVFETVLWCVLCTALWYIFGVSAYYTRTYQEAKTIIDGHKRSKISQTIDIIFAAIHFGIWFLVLYYKINLHSLVNLLQPCHLLLILQGFAVAYNGPNAAILGSLLLPLLSGAFGGLMYPATEGLDQPYEADFFYVQHYLMLFTGLFLLVRNNFCAMRISGLKSIFCANILVILMHWVLFSVSV
jgi:TMEM164 family